MKLRLSANTRDLAKESTLVVPFLEVPLAESAKLMVRAYEGTVDWEEGDNEEVALDELHNVIAGKYGEFIDRASFAIRSEEKETVAEVICSLLDGIPTILFIFTAPSHQGKGLAEALIRSAAHAADQQGYQRLQLFVTASNPAVNLYHRLGFGQ